MADAKITGITPAGLTLIGKYVCSSLTKLRPCPVCWIGNLLSDVSKNAINQINPNVKIAQNMKFMIPIITSSAEVAVPTKKSNCPETIPGILETIPTTIRIEVPLPTPSIVIWSAIHSEIIDPATIIDVSKIYPENVSYTPSVKQLLEDKAKITANDCNVAIKIVNNLVIFSSLILPFSPCLFNLVKYGITSVDKS